MSRKGRLIENLWDCPYCGSVEIKGRYEVCPHCGARREGGIEFYRKEINYVDEETAKNINKNPNWCCAFCNGLNSDDNKECESCGATRTSSDQNYFDKLKEKKEKERQDRAIMASYENKTSSYNTYNNSYNNSYLNNDSYEDNTSITRNIDNKKRNNSLNLFKKIGIALGSGLLAILIISLFIKILTPKEENIIINDFSWVREISIQEYKTINDEGFSLPTNARIISTEERISGYDKVIDHYETVTEEVPKERISGYEEYVSGYEDLGNGYSQEIISQRPIYETYYETVTREEPVYKDVPIYSTYYFYEEDKWVYKRSVETSGYDKNPYWGEYKLLNNERTNGEYEYYYIHYTDEKGETNKSKINYNDWKNLEKGQSLKVKISFGSIVEIIGVEIDESEETNFELNDAA